MSTEAQANQDGSFAVAAGRLAKARKIERVLCAHWQLPDLAGRRLLDVGCGSGHIAAYFARANDVDGVDVVDQRVPSEAAAFRFQRTESERLPFADATFDVVLSNHVIAYMRDQALHLQEAGRVLKPGGVVYLATPNRVFPLEPHYKTPLLHYLPAGLHNGIMRRLGRYSGPVSLPTLSGLRRLAAAAGLVLVDYTIQIVREPQRFGGDNAPLGWAPDWAAHLSPTLISILKKA